VDDAELLARHRAAVWEEVGDWDAAAMAEQVPVWTAYFQHALADQTYVAFVASDAGTVVGSGAILVHAVLPRPKFDSDRTGRVQSVYVLPAARHRGTARAIMDALLAYARDAGLISLSLHPSDEARALYVSLGFTAADEMRLNLLPESKPQRPPSAGRRSAG
jgi:ribosomal protein S18 acetylase RimI-like enzyme